MRHDSAWYSKLATRLGHGGYVTLAEIRQEEAREARESARTASWRRRGGAYHLDLDLNYYLVQRTPRTNLWEISAWPSGLGQERYVRRQSGIRTLGEAKGLALAQPCFRCGLACPLPFMTPVLPERPGQRTGPRPAFRCLDTRACEAERTRMTTGADRPLQISQVVESERAISGLSGSLPPEEAEPVSFTMTNAVTGESGQVTIDPGAFRPDCPNSLLRKAGL